MELKKKKDNEVLEVKMDSNATGEADIGLEDNTIIDNAIKHGNAHDTEEAEIKVKNLTNFFRKLNKLMKFLMKKMIILLLKRHK